MARHGIALACAATLALGAAACGGGDDETGDETVPNGVVAVVGDREVGNAELREQLEASRRAHSRGGAKPTRKQLEQQALAALLQRKWLEQEAERRGVEVSDAEVRKRWRAIARQQFRTRGQLRRFLGGQTADDVVAQLRVQALSDAIEQDVRREADGNPDQAVKQFRRRFDRERLEATECRDGYSAPGCDG
jgi:hypothetical protein